MFNPATCPGMGDEATWGPCTGHPMDPRTPEVEMTDDEMFQEVLEHEYEAILQSLCLRSAVHQFNTDHCPINFADEVHIIHEAAMAHVNLRRNFGSDHQVTQARLAQFGAAVLGLIEGRILEVAKQQIEEKVAA